MQFLYISRRNKKPNKSFIFIFFNKLYIHICIEESTLGILIFFCVYCHAYFIHGIVWQLQFYTKFLVEPAITITLHILFRSLLLLLLNEIHFNCSIIYDNNWSIIIMTCKKWSLKIWNLPWKCWNVTAESMYTNIQNIALFILRKF